MYDIVSIELVKCEELVLRLFGRTVSGMESTDKVVTALLEAKAEVLETTRDGGGCTPDYVPYAVLLRREVTNRKLRGL